MLNAERQPATDPRERDDHPAEVTPFPRPVDPAVPPTLGRGRKIVLSTLLVLTGLILATAGVSAASSPAVGAGDLDDCATQCPM